MKNIFLLLFFILSFISCKKEIVSSKFIDAQFAVVYKDVNGTDLLNPALSGAIKREDVDIYALKNGIKMQIFHANYDSPEMFEIKKGPQNFYFMNISFDVLSDHFEGNKITYLVRYKDGTEDQFIGEFNADREVNIFLLRVWANGVLKWEMGPNLTKPTEPIVMIR